MSTEIKTGWLKDKQGNKFAPKTLTSQVQTSDGTLLEDKIQDDLNAAKSALQVDIDKKIDTDMVVDQYETKADAESKLANANAYADDAAAAVKNDLLNGAGEAYDTLKELGDLIDGNTNALEALEKVATNKADKSVVEAISETVDSFTAITLEEIDALFTE